MHIITKRNEDVLQFSRLTDFPADVNECVCHLVDRVNEISVVFFAYSTQHFVWVHAPNSCTMPETCGHWRLVIDEIDAILEFHFIGSVNDK